MAETATTTRNHPQDRRHQALDDRQEGRRHAQSTREGQRRPRAQDATTAATAARPPVPAAEPRRARTASSASRRTPRRAVLIPVGAALVARDSVIEAVDAADDQLARQSSELHAPQAPERELKRFERRGNTARNRVEREVKKTRTRVERELRNAALRRRQGPHGPRHRPRENVVADRPPDRREVAHEVHGARRHPSA